jgi:hypothetical protein
MSETDDDDLWEMVNLSPAETGLSMTIYASPRGRARHAARVKVNGVPGRRMTLENESIVAVRPQPRVIHRGNLSPGDERQVFAWVVLNEAALIAYWDFTINTSEFLARLQQLPP